MNAQVNVLAVLDEVVADMGGDLPGTQGHELAKVRAAVAELIEAANAIAAHQDAATSSEWDRMNAALARVSGGAA